MSNAKPQPKNEEKMTLKEKCDKYALELENPEGVGGVMLKIAAYGLGAWGVAKGADAAVEKFREYRNRDI